MNEISLACSGWIADAMPGNRLRWTMSNGAALPKLVVERAPLKFRPLDKKELERLPREFRSDPMTELGWWQALPDIALDGPYPQQAYTLPAPVQGLRFRYAGPATTCITFAESGGPRLRTYDLLPGQAVVLLGAQLRQVVFRTGALTCTDVATLDLRQNRGLDWQPIATVRNDPQVPDSLDAARTRLPSGTLPGEAPADAGWWGALAELAAGVLPPGDPDDGQLPTPQQRFELARASRFWLAVLTGSAFVDGPRSVASAIDEISAGELLSAPRWAAYRVVDPGGTLAPSNAAISACYPIPDLAVPTGVRVTSATANYDGVVDKYLADVTIVCDRPSDATGVMLEHSFGPSRHADAPATSVTQEYRSTRLGADPLRLTIRRHDQVAGYDVSTTVRMAALDAWDRYSAWSDSTPDASLAFTHAPAAPWFGSAAKLNEPVDGVLLDRYATTWTPDRVVREADGRVIVCRRVHDPASATTTLRYPPVVDTNGTALLDVPLELDPAVFLGGRVRTDQGVFAIDALAGYAGGTQVHVHIPASANGPMPMPSGEVTIIQRDDDPALYADVPGSARPAVAYPATLQNSDPWDPHEATRTYRAVVEFDADAGPVRGPLGPAATAVAGPPVIAPPPDLTADILVTTADGSLDRDFYGRTLVSVEFAGAITSGGVRIAGAQGDATAYTRRKADGVLGEQAADGGTTFFEILNLPIPLIKPVTIGAAVVDDASRVASADRHTTITD